MVDEDLTMPCGSSAQGICRMGTASCIGGQWGQCEGAIEPMVAEVCDPDMLDENCNGTSNEGCECNPGDTKPCGALGLCSSGTQVCTSMGQWAAECSIKPQKEVCDGLADEDCDGAIDNGCLCTNGKSQGCSDAGMGACKTGTQVCSDGKWGACTSTVSKSAEVCDGIDNDCDGAIDNHASCGSGLKCFNKQCVECANDSDCKSKSCQNGMCCVPNCGKQCGGVESKCGTACTPSSCSADEMCAGMMCVPATSPCSADGNSKCDLFNAARCENYATNAGMRIDVCRWELRDPACHNAGGIWTTSDTTFAKNVPGCIPPNADGACLSDVSNLTCSDDEITKCKSVGATCDQQWNSTFSDRKDLCRWAEVTSGVKSGDPCGASGKGIWTPISDAFVTMWPRSVKQGTAGACITQVQNL